MPKFARHFYFEIQVGCFDHDGIGLLAVFDQIIDARTIPDVHQSGAAALRAENVIGGDALAIGQGDGLSLHEFAPSGSKRNAQGVSAIREKGTSGRFVEAEAEAISSAMLDREGGNLEPCILENNALFDGDQVDLDWWASASQNNAEQEIVDAFKGPAPAPDLQSINGFPAHEGREKTSQAKDVIEMPVGDQDAA